MRIVPVRQLLAAITLVASFTVASSQETREQKFADSLASFTLVKIPDGDYKGTKIKSLWFSQTEITWDVFDIWAFRMDQTDDEQAKGVDAKSRPSKPYGAPDRGFGHSGYPAIGMTFNSATLFCEWLSKKTGKKYRLPTEEEWEYACLGPSNETSPKAERAWFRGNSQFKSWDVGTKKANGWGLHDMLGNVMEWCTTKEGPPVCRGGSFMDPEDKVTPFERFLQTPKWNENDPQNPKSKWWLANASWVGLRVVCED
jgi:formylglycine-generating enzyme required for sulfatase activity